MLSPSSTPPKDPSQTQHPANRTPDNTGYSYHSPTPHTHMNYTLPLSSPSLNTPIYEYSSLILTFILILPISSPLIINLS
ncbi:MAG: hypothetical protein ACW96X_11535 [Promethearchaeota archaeon]